MSTQDKVEILKVAFGSDPSDTHDLILDFDGCEVGGVYLASADDQEVLFQTTVEAVIAAGEWLKQQKGGEK